jgi:hypothetical protein
MLPFLLFSPEDGGRIPPILQQNSTRLNDIISILHPYFFTDVTFHKSVSEENIILEADRGKQQRSFD